MTIAHGYHRDADSVIYVTEAGTMYLVYEADALEPLWRKCAGQGEGYPSPDAETARLSSSQNPRSHPLIQKF